MVKTYLGDCLKVLKDFEDKSVDVSFTSPPYNRTRNDKYEFYEDILDNYYDFLCAFTDELLRVTKGYVIVNIQKTYFNKQDVLRYMGHYADLIQEIVVWVKSNPMPSTNTSLTNSYEFFLMFNNEPIKANNTYIKNVITTSVNGDMPKEHKAVMKQEVADWFIEQFTQENDTVLDPFMGVGTTGISCSRFNRNFIGIEINKTYYDMAKDRMNDRKLF